MPAPIVLNPIVVVAASGTAIRSDQFNIWKIRWVNGTAAGHALLIQDAAGQAKFGSVAAGANYVESETFDPPLQLTGLKVPTLGSGTLYIYVES